MSVEKICRRIWVQGREPRLIAVTENGRLTEFLREEKEAGSTECILLGRVVRVVGSMQAAFVDIGQEKNGFLPLKENSRTYNGQPLREGMRVTVQVKKDAHDGKGAFLTRDISLCGRYVLLMPCNRYIGVSARIERESDRERLKALGRSLAGESFGLVMRAAALEADEPRVKAELDELLEQWRVVSHMAPTAHAPSVLFRPRTVLDSLLDDYLPRGLECIVTDDPSLTAEGAPVRLTEPGFMEREGLTAQRDRALERRVWLDCGGNLVFDACEAMTVVDVNTSANTGRQPQEQAILQTDLEAAQEIARQVRLRNLSGIILIDMIDLAEEAHRQQVLDALKQAFAADRVKTVIHGMTSLGLVEMTRKKTRVPLRDEWTDECPCCHGSGRVRKEERRG